MGIPELITALYSPDGNTRRLAASALGKIRAKQAVDPLLDLLQIETKSQIRQYIVKALGSIGDRRVTNILEKIASNDQEIYYVRKSAQNALKQFANLMGNSELPTNVKNGANVTDSITSFINASHPRPLIGSWDYGWSLGFHSRFSGGDWAWITIGDLTYRLKYECDTSVLPTLVTQTVELTQLHPELIRVDVILPVPPSTARPPDPVQLFCTALAEKTGIPMQTTLSKTRQTQPQKEMKTLAQKRTNVSGAFTLRGDFKGKRLLLVDDLFDSGATLEEITRLLKKHGALTVTVLALTCTIHSDA